MRRLQRLILISLLALFLFPLSCYAQIDQETMLLQATQHLEKGEYYYATTWLERLLKSYPKSPHRREVLLLMSKAYAASDREEKAAKALRTLLKEYPETAASLDPKLLNLANPDVRAATPPLDLSAPAQKPALSSKSTMLSAAPPSASASVPTTPSSPGAPAPAGIAVGAGAAALTANGNAVAAEAGSSVKEQSSAAGAPVRAPVRVTPTKAAGVETASSAVNPTAKAMAGMELTGKTSEKEAGAVLQEAKPAPAAVSGTAAAPVKMPTPPATAQITSLDQGHVAAEKEPLPATGQQAAPAANDEKAAAVTGYTIKVGEYVLKSAMSGAKKKIVDAGLSPEVVQGPRTEAAMIRLQVEAPTDQESARKALEKLKKAQGQGIILRGKDGKYHVYAGSYYDERIGEMEQDRLSAQGIKTTMHAMMIPVPTFLLTAGTYPTRQAAQERVVKLHKQGVETVIIENGK